MTDQQEVSNTPQIDTIFNLDLIQRISSKSYLNSKTVDVYFSIVAESGAVKRIGAHKNVLSAASDVFDAMFYGELKEKDDVHITDVSEAAFIEFLQFFYLAKVQLTIENITGILYLRHKYIVPDCVNACVQFLKANLTVDNIVICFHLAIEYDLHELMKLCETFVTLNTAEIFKTAGFLECDKRALARILKADILSCSEVEVFKACMAWVWVRRRFGTICQNDLSKTVVMDHLGELYYEIRFASMTMQQLFELLSEYRSVLLKDFETISKLIVMPGFQTDQFKTNKRHANWNVDAIVNCNLTSKHGSEIALLCDKSKPTTTFSTNKPLLLGSFVCSRISEHFRSS